MPQRSAVSQLPDAIRKELEQKLLKGGFSGYEDLSAWLAAQGYAISKSAIHRFGQKYEARLAKLRIATDQAKLMAAELGDDEGAMNEALIRRYQTQVWELMDKIEELDLDPTKVKIESLGRTIAEMTRASVTQKKWAEQMREKVEAKFAALEREAEGQTGTLDIDTLKRVREEIYGIV
jgi:hypothetical protein